jgi:hypothetical protein
MSASAPPLVYCETNWIVALAFPHHQLHGLAKNVHEAGKRGECSVRVPATALLEARETLSDVSTQLSSSFAALRNDVARAAENGLGQFSPLALALQSDVVDTYAQRNTLSLLGTLETDSSIRVLEDVAAHITTVRELRSRVHFAAKDIVDLHLLAAIIHDRRQNIDGPALFFSHNKKEFSPKRGKVPDDLYAEAKLLWSDDFDLKSRLGQWRSRYGSQRS